MYVRLKFLTTHMISNHSNFILPFCITAEYFLNADSWDPHDIFRCLCTILICCPEILDNFPDDHSFVGDVYNKMFALQNHLS